MNKSIIYILAFVLMLSLVYSETIPSGHQHNAGMDMSNYNTVNSSSSSINQSLILTNHNHQSDTKESSFSIIFNVSFSILFILGIFLFFSNMSGKNLMDYKFFKSFIKSKFYPKILQIPTLIFFGFIIYYFFFGSLSYSKNPGSILSWTLWWPLVPLTFILFGRLWCALCPLPIIGDFIQKFIHPSRKPGNFLMKYGIWITDGIFIFITLFDRLYGMVDTPWLSGIVFLLLLFGVIIFSIRYERRAFCKHVCFLGGVSGNYSMLSALSIEAKDKAVCASCRVKACYFGSGKIDGCPYSNVIPAKSSMRNCTLCANCIKACPNDNIAVRVRTFASELWNSAKVTFSESFFAKLMVGIVIIQNLGMLAIWFNALDFLMNHGLSRNISIIILYFSAIVIPLLLMTISSFISNKLQSVPLSTSSNFAAFGYSFIPIDVAGHIAHNLFHLLSEGKSIVGAFIGLFSGNVILEGPVAGSSSITILQYILILIGALGTFFVAYKIARAKENNFKSAIKILLPHAVLILIILTINIFLFMTPMSYRGA